MILHQIIPNKEVFNRSEILEILSNYTIIPKRDKTERIPTPKEIKEIIEEVLGVHDISERSRRRELSDARHIYSFICYYHKLGTYQQIGDVIERDHATILHSFQTTRDYLNSKGHNTFKEKYNKVAEIIMNRYENIRL